MNIIEKLQSKFHTFLSKHFSVEQTVIDQCTLLLNTDENKQQFGDLSSNAPMVLARALKKNPRQIAQTIVDEFTSPALEKIEIAGPGFLNFYLTQKTFDQLAQQMFDQKTTFFKPGGLDEKRYNIEFVSANPTGPLHFGHGRGGIIGDVLAKILSFLGHQVTKEFYINDAGSQMQKLGNSLRIRYQQQAGLDVKLPEDAYHGSYLMDIAKELHSQHGNKVIDKPDAFFIDHAKEHLLALIKKTLNSYGITYDVWFSEKTLHDSGKIDQAIAQLQDAGHLFQKDDALWFASTSFGDDKDRVVKKQNGELTYAAADIAYMKDKIERKHDHLIYILGHDHHSYATRLKGLLQALDYQLPLDVILYQLVRMKEGDKQVRMSKRAGAIITLQEIIEAVGKDVARFFYLNRKADAQLEFDMDLAQTNTDENPVYYIQYAYVRTGSIEHKANEHTKLQNITAKDLDNLTFDDDLLIKKIVELKELLSAIGINQQTHLLAYYSYELAQTFNKYYNKNRVIDLDDIKTSRARLALVAIVRTALTVCLDLLGISKPEKM